MQKQDLLSLALASLSILCGTDAGAARHSFTSGDTSPRVIRSAPIGEEATPGVRLAPTQPWPRVFYQEYSRSQDGEAQDASYHVRFWAEPAVGAGGELCLRITLKLEVQATSRRMHFRDRMNHLSAYNTGTPMPGAGPAIRLMTPEMRRQRSASFEGGGLRAYDFGQVSFQPVYIAVGMQSYTADLVIGCIRTGGAFSGEVEVKAFPDSVEKIRIPWSFRYANGEIGNMRFHLGERAVRDPDEFTTRGRLHPRRSLVEGEALEEVPYHFTGSSRYPDGAGAPDGYYQLPYPDPNRPTVDL